MASDGRNLLDPDDRPDRGPNDDGPADRTDGSRPGRGRGVLSGLAILGVLAAWLAVGAFGGMAQGRLSEVQRNDTADFLPASAESTRAAEIERGFSDAQAPPAFGLIESQTDLDPQGLAEAQAFAESVGSLAVTDGDGRAAGTVQDYLSSPVVAVPSEDGRAILFPIALNDRASEPLADGHGAIGPVVEVVRTAMADELAHLGETFVTGPAGYVADLSAAFAGIDGILVLVALAVVLVILIVVYRSPSLPFAVIVTAVLGLCGAALIVYHLADAGRLTLNGQSQGILFILVVGAATDYSLLLVARYREELVRRESVYAAMRAAWRASLEPISASAGTVAIGVLCLLLSDLASNKSLGPVAAIGIVCAYLAAMTALPALLLIAGRRSRAVFWPRIPHYRPAVVDETADGAHPHGLWSRVAAFVGRHSRAVWIAVAGLLVAAAVWAPGFSVGANSESELFRTEVGSVTGGEALARHFPVGATQPAVVAVPEASLTPALDRAETVDGVSSAAARTDTATGAPAGGAPTDSPPRIENGWALIDVVLDDAPDSQAALDTVSRLRTALHDVDSEALIGGPSAEALDQELTSERDLRLIVPVVLLVVFLILVLLLRSVVAPLILLFANVLSFGATLGVAALVFRVAGLPSADPAVPLYGFVFLVALGVDYSIFLMTRVREESLQQGTRSGVLGGLAVTGSVITSAGIVLAATFAALGVIPLLFLAQLAFIVAFGVLVDTFLVRSLLVPALVRDVGDAAWWPWRRRFVQASAARSRVPAGSGDVPG